MLGLLNPSLRLIFAIRCTRYLGKSLLSPLMPAAAVENLSGFLGSILFCGWNARCVHERGDSAHRLAVGLWFWGWLGPIIGRGGVRGGFWGCGGTLRFAG